LAAIVPVDYCFEEDTKGMGHFKVDPGSDQGATSKTDDSGGEAEGSPIEEEDKPKEREKEDQPEGRLKFMVGSKFHQILDLDQMTIQVQPLHKWKNKSFGTVRY
jgi:hypothetical protein